MEYEREKNASASPKSYQENINSQNSAVFMTLVQTQQETREINTKRSDASSEYRDNPPEELVSKKKQDMIKRNQGVLTRI
jgi:hypothetical protein